MTARPWDSVLTIIRGSQDDDGSYWLSGRFGFTKRKKMLKNLCRSYDVELNDLEADWAATIALTREGCFGVWRSVLDFETTGEPVFTYVNVLASRDKAACLQLLSTLNEDDFLVVAPEVES